MKRLRVIPFVALVLLGLAAPASAGIPLPEPTLALNDGEEPGSVLVFHKFIRGTVSTPDQGELPATELEISVTCPRGVACADGQPVRLRGHWVCPGDRNQVCGQAAFELQTTVKGTLFGGTEDVSPRPPCPRGYLIVWVIDDFGQPIKFDGLIGDAVIRRSETSAAAYNALPIQAAEELATGAPTDLNGNGRLDFDGTEYRAITGRIFGTVRYESAEVETSLTFLTLDVASNQMNAPTSANLDFFNEREQRISGSVRFVCWKQVRLTRINPGLTTAFGRKGLVESGSAQQGGQPATLVGIIETREFFEQPVTVSKESCTQTCTVDAWLIRVCDPPHCHTTHETVEVPGQREYSYSLFNDSTPVATTFAP